MVLSRCAAALLLVLLAGCGRDEAAGPEDVEVSVGSQQVAVRPVQYCLDGDGQRYSNTPPIIEDLIKLLDDVGEGLRRGRHPDRGESRRVASVLRAVATDLEG